MIRRYQVQTPLGPVGLASDEKLVSIERSVVVPPAEPEPPMAVLLRMAGASHPDELGMHGPAIAALANRENAGNPELRRYEAKFGRDALYAAEFLANVHPRLEDGTVRYLAAYQSVRWDSRRLSSPGKVPNHIRDPSDPLAQRLSKETGRRWPWYGGTDTTVQFLSAACRLVDRHPDVVDEIVRYPADHVRHGEVAMRDDAPLTLGRVLRDAANWLLRKLRDPRGRSLVWAGLNRRDSFTLWTDSPNAFHHRDGRLAQPPVAPVQLQAQAYDALMALVPHAALHADLRLDPAVLEREARAIRARFADRFAVSDERGTFLASGVERAGEGVAPLCVRTVSMGFTLDSAILEGADFRSLREAVVRSLLSEDMISPFGIVGRARDEIRFEPFDYHAQIWGFAVHKVARGLARHGHHDLASEMDARVLRQCEDGLFPENVGARDSPTLEYCPHVLTVQRPAPDGRQTITVKERPPAPYAAWTVAAVMAIHAKRDGVVRGGTAAMDSASAPAGEEPQGRSDA